MITNFEARLRDGLDKTIEELRADTAQYVIEYGLPANEALRGFLFTPEHDDAREARFNAILALVIVCCAHECRVMQAFMAALVGEKIRTGEVITERELQGKATKH